MSFKYYDVLYKIYSVVSVQTAFCVGKFNPCIFSLTVPVPKHTVALTNVQIFFENGFVSSIVGNCEIYCWDARVQLVLYCFQ